MSSLGSSIAICPAPPWYMSASPDASLERSPSDGEAESLCAPRASRTMSSGRPYSAGMPQTSCTRSTAAIVAAACCLPTSSAFECFDCAFISSYSPALARRRHVYSRSASPASVTEESVILSSVSIPARPRCASKCLPTRLNTSFAFVSAPPSRTSSTILPCAPFPCVRTCANIVCNPTRMALETKDTGSALVSDASDRAIFESFHFALAATSPHDSGSSRDAMAWTAFVATSKSSSVDSSDVSAVDQFVSANSVCRLFFALSMCPLWPSTSVTNSRSLTALRTTPCSSELIIESCTKEGRECAREGET